MPKTVPWLFARARIPAASRHASTSSSSNRPSLRPIWLIVPLAGAAYAYDHYVYADGIQRSLRTLYTGIAIAADYKISFRPSRTDAIAGMHERVAARLHKLCVGNGGLYIKLGQG
jgi:aarF domain-containing kinase